VGVVSLPSGLIASGFSEVVGKTAKEESGDGYYELKFAELEGVPPPASRFGPAMDSVQTSVLAFLNAGFVKGVMLTLILANIVAVIVETIPAVDRYVGNEPYNLFDVFEALSVIVFSAEFALRLFSIGKDREHLYSAVYYATTFFGIVDVLSFAPWYLQHIAIALGWLSPEETDAAAVIRIFRLFRLLQLERIMTAFTLLDNVFRASASVLKATGLMALIVWLGGAALFFLFERDNPNWRTCDDEVDAAECFAFESVSACNTAYPGACSQTGFTTLPDAMYLTAVFLCGEWGLVDFTWGGRAVAVFMCVAGIAIAAIPIGSLFEAFGSVVGIEEGEEEDE